ncbi:MAG: metal-dependent phosphohydrolase [Cellvibrionaceae bacterium]|nr:metal-dependent phosphohydrolase [Cellvibrionaceae bacterium]
MTLLARTFQGFNQWVLREVSEQCFEPITPRPQALSPLFKLDDEFLHIGEQWPFLLHFLYDAKAHWIEQHAQPLISGIWLEDCQGKEIALEASALYVDGESLLIVHEIERKYGETAYRLQSSRDHLLVEEELEREVARRTRQIIAREEQISLCLLAAAGCRDEETGAHIRRIGLYSAVMAEALGWGIDQVDHIRMAAPMHDIGKIGIPDYILQKPGALENDERSLMETHAAIGASMLSDTGIEMMDMARDIAQCHHERWDGSGYPKGLRGEEIPIAARITAIVDIYDALVHKRVYKPAYSEEKTYDIMSSMSGSHLDPRLFELFQQNLAQIQAIRQQVQD